MDILFCLLLITLGLLAAEDYARKTFPATGGFFTALNRYADYFGFAGIVVGLIWFIRAINFLRYANGHVLLVLSIWVLTALTLTLGLIFGLKLLRLIIGEPAPAFIVRAEEWRVMLLPYRRELGLSAIVLGVIFIL